MYIISNWIRLCFSKLILNIYIESNYIHINLRLAHNHD